jgi:hypothetical protein
MFVSILILDCNSWCKYCITFDYIFNSLKKDWFWMTLKEALILFSGCISNCECLNVLALLPKEVAPKWRVHVFRQALVWITEYLLKFCPLIYLFKHIQSTLGTVFCLVLSWLWLTPWDLDWFQLSYFFSSSGEFFALA